MSSYTLPVSLTEVDTNNSNSTLIW